MIYQYGGSTNFIFLFETVTILIHPYSVLIGYHML